MNGIPHPCQDPDCPELVYGSYGRCPAHRRKADARRGTTTQRGYGADWARLSARVIREEKRCRDCGHAGSKTNPLTCDHIVPKVMGGTDARSNLCCRCRVHNSSKGPRTTPVYN